MDKTHQKNTDNVHQKNGNKPHQKNTNERKLDELGLIPKYYHLRDYDTTTCILLSRTNGLTSNHYVVARGVAVCSDLDQFRRKSGRAVALGRALQAVKHGTSIGKIPKKRNKNITRTLQNMFGDNIGYFHPVPTDAETVMINKVRQY